MIIGCERVANTSFKLVLDTTCSPSFLDSLAPDCPAWLLTVRPDYCTADYCTA